MTPPQKKELWHFSKEIPVSMLLVMVGQAAAFVWFFSGLSKQVEDSKARIAYIESQRVSERLAALESQMIDSRGSLTRIENKLDRLIEKERQ